MLDAEELEEGAALTGAELLHCLTTRNERQREETSRKLREYTKLQEVLERLTERCRVPVLAPVAGGMAYFEATMEYTNNIMVLLGDGWFAERSAKQAREIAGRRIEFLRREERVLAEEAAALQQRQALFLAEVPNAEQAMLEAAALEQEAPDPQRADGGAAEASEAPLQLALRDADLAVVDELDQLTEEELLEIERELGDRIEDDELVERVMTERIIAKKEKRVRAELRQGRTRELHLSTAAAAPQRRGEDQQQQPPPPSPSPHPKPAVTTSAAPAFGTPGDIGRAAAAVVSGTARGNANAADAAGSSRRRVKFSDVVDVVSPEGAAATVALPPAPCHVVGDVVEHGLAATSSSPAPAATAPKRKSLFRSEMEHFSR
ncbi:uncharacterized protein Tco025E_01980 [Trypanosoma conorhini]|uniref:Uncharacterized protein n=1 Tax=Trypanosoma conorhini TaxID=83891 RepID=A0A422Q701_9TRYP|nr:uncharacterized protein Tco025E_01980 [Trypanosoma conorhini]RNF25740.1 hypothetical protein Tco025E_01980 [Trypanosoma conorhini]